MSFSQEELKYWRGIFIQHRAQCAQKDIGFDLTFEEWLDVDRKSTRLNSSHSQQSRMPSSA